MDCGELSGTSIADAGFEKMQPTSTARSGVMPRKMATMDGKRRGSRHAA
jgi:hypothetical protein